MSLEETVSQRTKELQDSNILLKEFVGISSHDLQEPLRKIIILGDRLKTKINPIDKDANNYLDRIQNAASRMKALVEDLLLYSTMENQARSFERVDLNKVIETLLEDFETRISETQGTVNIGNLPVVDGDPVQMHQLFQNLIGNALKFIRDGIPPVVNLDSSNLGNGFWNISVEDNGIGIVEEHVKNIFKPFERLHGKDAYEGTGIGLTICNKIVTRLGGKIDVIRNSTGGATFQVTLPEKQNV